MKTKGNYNLKILKKESGTPKKYDLVQFLNRTQ